MPINTSSWSKNQPSGSSSIKEGDDQIRSDKSMLQAVLNDEHYFAPQDSTSSASGGIHRKGSARVYTGTRSQVSTAGADQDGRLMYAADTDSLHLLGTSSHTTISHGKAPPGAAASFGGMFNVSSSSTLPFNNESWDVGGFFSPTTTRITVPSGFSGTYMVEASSLMTHDTAHGKGLLEVRKNGGSIILGQWHAMGTPAGNPQHSAIVNVAGIVRLSDGDYIEMLVSNGTTAGNVWAGSGRLTLTRL